MKITEITSFLKLEAWTLCSVAITCGVLIFNPFNILNTIGIADSIQNYKTFIGIGFILSTSLVFVGTVKKLIVLFNKQLANRRTQKLATQRLHSLTNEEKEILARYISGQVRSLRLKCGGVVIDLCKVGILYRSSDIGSQVPGGIITDFNIEPWAWDYLNNKKHLIGLS
jgi:hypothetical protein